MESTTISKDSTGTEAIRKIDDLKRELLFNFKMLENNPSSSNPLKNGPSTSFIDSLNKLEEIKIMMKKLKKKSKKLLKTKKERKESLINIQSNKENFVNPNTQKKSLILGKIRSKSKKKKIEKLISKQRKISEKAKLNNSNLWSIKRDCIACTTRNPSLKKCSKSRCKNKRKCSNSLKKRRPFERRKTPKYSNLAKSRSFTRKSLGPKNVSFLRKSVTRRNSKTRSSLISSFLELRDRSKNLKKGRSSLSKKKRKSKKKVKNIVKNKPKIHNSLENEKLNILRNHYLLKKVKLKQPDYDEKNQEKLISEKKKNIVFSPSISPEKEPEQLSITKKSEMEREYRTEPKKILRGYKVISAEKSKIREQEYSVIDSNNKVMRVCDKISKNIGKETLNKEIEQLDSEIVELGRLIYQNIEKAKVKFEKEMNMRGLGV